MTDDHFRELCNTFGFAPSRALRELIDCATARAEAAQRERIIAQNAPEIEKVNAHIKALEDELAAIREKATGMSQWHSLTDDEIKEIVGPWGDTPIKGYTRKLFDQIEAKLREKNT